MDMTGWPCKCQWDCTGGKECHGNQTFERRLRERCEYCKESCKNCVVVEKCDSASCKGRCRFHRSWDEEMAEMARNEAPGRPVTPEREPSLTPSRPTPSRKTQAEDTPLRRLVLNPPNAASSSHQASPCPEEVMTNTEEEEEAAVEEAAPLGKKAPPAFPTQAAQTITQEEPVLAETSDRKKGQAGPKQSALLRSLLTIQGNKEKTRLRREAVLKTFAERLANDFQNMERLTQLSLGGTMRRVFTIVSDAINQTAPSEGAGQTTGKKSENRGGSAPSEPTNEGMARPQQRQTGKA